MSKSFTSEPDFRALFECGPGLYLVLDPSLVIVGASDAYCGATMTAREAIVGRHLFEAFPDNPNEDGATGVANLKASLERVMTLRRPDAMALQKYDIRKPDGEGGGFEERYWSPLNTPILDNRGNVAWIVHRVEDVTDLVKHNSDEAGFDILLREQQGVIDKLRAANRELARKIEENNLFQQDRYRLASIAEWSDDAMITKTLDGIVTGWNPSAARIFGYDANEMIGRSLSIIVPTELANEEDDILARVRDGQSIDHYVTRRLHKNGDEIYITLTVSPLRNILGEVVGASKIARDVTEKRKAEARLEDLQSELIHLSRWNMMGMMASTIAHELNQPLTAVANYAAALKRILANPGFSVAAADDILDKIVKQRERASQIVDRLRKQVARGGAERRAEHLGAVVAEALELAAPTVQKAGVLVRVDAPTALPTVLIDRVQIQQVIVNIVRNAVEAMERAKQRQLIVSLHSESHGVRVDIADFGPGLSKDVAERLFQPFVTTKSSGMGLGLSICKNIIESHGGELSARPNTPRGTVFSFVLPAHADDVPVSGEAAE